MSISKQALIAVSLLAVTFGAAAAPPAHAVANRASAQSHTPGTIPAHALANKARAAENRASAQNKVPGTPPAHALANKERAAAKRAAQ